MTEYALMKYQKNLNSPEINKIIVENPNSSPISLRLIQQNINNQLSQRLLKSVRIIEQKEDIEKNKKLHLHKKNRSGSVDTIKK